MLNTNITNFRKNISGLLEQTIKYNEPVNVSTKDGNAVIISEEDYNGLCKPGSITSTDKPLVVCSTFRGNNLCFHT